MRGRHTLDTYSTLYKACNPYYTRIIWSLTQRQPREDPVKYDDTYFPRTRSNCSSSRDLLQRVGLLLTKSFKILARVCDIEDSSEVRPKWTRNNIFLLIKEIWRSSSRISTQSWHVSLVTSDPRLPRRIVQAIKHGSYLYKREINYICIHRAVLFKNIQSFLFLKNLSSIK